MRQAALVVSNGALVNAQNATIISDGPGGARTLQSVLDNQGTLTVNRDLAINGSSIINRAGALINGTQGIIPVGAPLTNEGILAPGVSSIGRIPITGDYIQTPAGAMNVGIGGLVAGTEHDQVHVSNNMNLGGTLNISLENGFQPAEGDSFEVVTFFARSDTFTTVTGRDIGNGLFFNVFYRPNRVVLIAGDPPPLNIFTITASAGANGTISPIGPVDVNGGEDQTFIITPNPGYQVADVLVDGVSIGAVSSHGFTNVTMAHTISATFSVQTFTITTSAGANGSISPDGNIAVNGGENQAFQIAPDAGYHVLDVLVDSVSIGAVSSFVFSSVTENHTIAATFEINTYTIFSSSGSNGSITPEGNIPVTHGTDQIFTISPSLDFGVGDVFVDGVSQGALTTYEFTNVSTNHTITAFFTPDNFNYTTLDLGTNEDLTGVAFVNDLLGYAVGPGGLLLITTDGGQTWTSSNIGVPIDLTGVTVIEDTLFVTGVNGHICYSVDGGQTWVDASPGANTTFYSTTFINGSYGFACGANGIIYFWNGTSWVPQQTGVITTFYSVYAIGGTAYAVGAGGVIFKFNGVNWIPLNSGASVDFYGVSFFTQSFGYAVGAGGVIYRTTDGGQTWTSLFSGVSVIIRQIVIGDLNTAWAVCDGGVILQTTDGGQTWEIIEAGNGSDFAAVSFVNGHGFIVGSGGVGYTFESSVVSSTPVFSVAPGSLDFGNVGVDFGRTRFVTVSNPGTGPLNVSSASSDNSAFTVNPVGASIPPASSLPFAVTFRPTSTGQANGTVSFSHDAAGSPGTVSVTGNGVESGLTFTPLTTGTTHNFSGVSFRNANIGYASATGGRVFITGDAGQTWTTSNTGVTTDLTGIRLIGSSLFITGVNGLICVSTDGGLTWTPFNTGTSANFYASHFINAFYGFAVGSSGAICIYNGAGWTAQSTGTTETFYGVYAVGSTAYAVGSNGIICKYIGTQWVPQVSNTTVTLNAVRFVNESFGYAVGNGGVILRTVDGGANWVVLNSGVTVDISDCEILSPDIAWVTCAGGLVLQTTDGGVTWIQIPLEIPENLTGIDFDPIGCRGYVVGQSGVAYTFESDFCTPAGNDPNYTLLTTGVTKRLTGISFINANLGCVAGFGGTVLITNDGGQTWVSSNTGISTDLTGIHLVGSTAFITGLGGLICTSNDGGLTWIPFNTGTTANFYGSSFLSATYGFAVGANGTICFYNGAGWVAQTTGVTNTFYGVFAIGGVAYAVGTNGIICKYNGVNWVALNSGTNVTFYDVAFVNERFGYAVGAGGIICRTRDGGLTWEPLNSGVTADLLGCKVVSPKVAYCVGDDGVVLRTEDCGETWEPVNLAFPGDLAALEIVDGRGFLVGEEGLAYSFENSVLTDFPLFSLLTSDLDFGEVPVAGSLEQNLLVTNPGTVALNISLIEADNEHISITPENVTVAPGDTAFIAVTFTPAAAETVTCRLVLTHDAFCELDTVEIIGIGIGPGMISGTIRISGSSGLANVLVKLLDGNGEPSEAFDDIQTQSQGTYEFNEVAPGDYQVMIVEPLGYTVDENPKSTTLPAGGHNIIDFVLTEQVVSNQARSKGYWKHQFDVYVKGKGHAQESEEDLQAYITTIHEKYTPRFDLFDGLHTFEEWQDVLTVKGKGSMIERARQQLAAFVFNMVSLKVGQYAVVTGDGRTAGDVLTYVSVLIADGDPANDELAKDLAEHINLQRPIDTDLIPEGNILYKAVGGTDWNFQNAPETFALRANYPNPFNPSTTIAYDVPQQGHIQLIVYNLLGQEVTRLVDQAQAPGRYTATWNGRNTHGLGVASGIYLFRMTSSTGFTQTRRMVLLK